MSNIIALLVLLFSVVQLRLLYKEHLVLLSYTPQERLQEPIGWYQFHTYGTALVYLGMVYVAVQQLMQDGAAKSGGVVSAISNWKPSMPFAREPLKGGGTCSMNQNRTRLQSLRGGGNCGVNKNRARLQSLRGGGNCGVRRAQ